MQAKMQEESGLDFHVNAHRVRFTPPDIIRIWWCGNVNRQEFCEILEFGHRNVGDRRHIVLADISELKSVDPDARKAAATDPRNRNVTCIAMIGATFHARVLITMVTRAMEFLSRNEAGKIRFFNTEAEALVWIAADRELLNLAGAAS